MTPLETQPLVTLPVIGTPLLLTDYDRLFDACRRWTAGAQVMAIEFANTQTVTLRRTDEGFRSMTDAYDYLVPDGMPLIWCLNAQGAGLSDRVYGPTFMRKCLQSNQAPSRHFFVGGSPELGARLREVVRQWNPAAQIVGSFHGEVANDGRLVAGGDDGLIREINQASPDWLWVGLGTPKQQAWVHRNKNRIRRGVILGVGFGFDVNAGMKRDAPAWMQRSGLTWVFRLITEPRRLAGRYLKYNSLFLFHLLRDRCRGTPEHPRTR